MKKINLSIIFILLLFIFFSIGLSGYKRSSNLASANLIISSIHKKLKAMELKADNIKKMYAETKVIKNRRLLRSLKNPDKTKFNTFSIQIKAENRKMTVTNSLMKQINNNLSDLQSEFFNLNKEILKAKKKQGSKKYSKSKARYINQLQLKVENLRKTMALMNFSKLKKARKYIDVKNMFRHNLKSPNVIYYKGNDLSIKIKTLDNDMEEVRNKRSEFQTMFENFDQKANQLFNILATVLKTMKEMKSGVSRNLL